MENQRMGSPSSNVSQLRIFISAVALVCLACAAKDKCPDFLLATLPTHTKEKYPLAKVPPVFNKLQRVFTEDAFVQKETAAPQKVIAPKVSREMLPHSASKLDWWPLFVFTPVVVMIVWTALRVQSAFQMQQQNLDPLEDVTLADTPIPHLAMAAASGRKKPFALNSSPDGVQKEPESTEDAIKGVEKEIKALQKTIKGVQRQINAVQKQISAVNQTTTSLNSALIAMARGQEVDMEEEPTLYLFVDETKKLNLKKLMQEKGRLDAKEKTLDEEKKMLMEKEKILMEKEKILMEDKRLLKAELSQTENGLRAGGTQSADGSEVDLLNKLIDALQKGDYDKQDNSVAGYEKYTLKDKDLNWLYQFNPGEPLIARKSTKELYDRIQREPGCILIIGNPGIGKTWFHNYFLLRWLPTMKDDDILLLHSVHKRTGMFMLKKGARITAISDGEARKLLFNRNVTYLADTGGTEANEPWIGFARTILTSSPSIRHYKMFSAERKPLTLYYDPWNLEELHAAKPANFSGALLEERFELVGGIPRYVFHSDLDFQKHWATVQHAIKNINWAMPYDWDANNDLEVPPCVFVQIPNQDYTDFAVTYASDVKKEMLKDHYRSAAWTARMNLLQITRDNPKFGVFWGLMYEADFLSHFLDMEGKTFCLPYRRLSVDVNDQTKPKEPKEPYDKLEIQIQGPPIMADIDAQALTAGNDFPKGQMVRPLIQNFTGIDALILDGTTVYGLQATKALTHDFKPKGLDKLKPFKMYGYTRVLLLFIHPIGAPFSLTGQAQKMLRANKDIEVYEAEWEPPALKKFDQLPPPSAEDP